MGDGGTAPRDRGLRQTADRQLREETQQKQRIQQRLEQEAAEAEEEPLHRPTENSISASKAVQQDSQATTGASDMAIMSLDADEDVSAKETNFFDLPQEVRDMVYAYFPYLASIHINQDPSLVVQPAISKVCHHMRKESLDVFYGKNNFFLDLRGWKSPSYERRWTPRMIFDHWITAMGNENTARLRSLSFFSHNFRVNIKISNEKPPTLKLRFRTSLTKAEIADGVPSSYNFEIAARRAEVGLQHLLDDMQAGISEQGMSVDNFKAISAAIDYIQPFLCRRISLGHQGAVLLEDDVPMDQWPSIAAHQDKCDDCGYHRYTRGTLSD